MILARHAPGFLSSIPVLSGGSQGQRQDDRFEDDGCISCDVALKFRP
jgi:hypothetical protein